MAEVGTDYINQWLQCGKNVVLVV